MSVSRILLALWLTVLQVLPTEKPAVEQIFPAGNRRGATNEITLLGKLDSWPLKAWANISGLDFHFSTNKGKADLAIAADAPLGPCLVRFYNDEGASDLRIFVVTDQPELFEQEPNDHFAKAQFVTNRSTTINGRLEKNGDIDSFRLKLKGGEWLDVALDSYTILAKLDPVLRLATTNGYQLAWNHDFSSLDPRLTWQAPYDLTAVLQVFGFAYPADSDIRLSGGPAGVYRLNWQISDTAPADLREKSTEREPNDRATNAPLLELPATLVGTVSPTGDVDRFRLDLKKDQQIEARVLAADIGSPLDAWLAVENSEGHELARNDDADNSRDPRLEWKALQDGNYILAVGSVTHRGSPDLRYHLSVRSVGPEFRITAGADALQIVPGSTNALKLICKRLRGFTNELEATVRNLPENVSAAPLTIPAKDGEAFISIIAATNASPHNGAFQVIITDKTSNVGSAAPFDLISRTENNGVPGGYSKLLVESSDQLWLTVKSPPPPKETRN